MKKLSASYPLDNSAIIHLAAMQKKYANSFRISATLKDTVCPKTLQEALDHVTPRFPTIVAGIRRGFFQYMVVPVKESPQIRREQEVLPYMTEKEIRTCAMRVFYSEYQISVDLFHSLTDGYGGSVFLNTLLAEYFLLRYSNSCSYTEQILNPRDLVDDTEICDDFITYAGTRGSPANHKKVYRLPAATPVDGNVHIFTGMYDTEVLLNAAHHWGVSLTVFLTAVMFDSVMELQRKYTSSPDSYEPVQLMVPINLRRKFESRTLRNFSLYALPCIEPAAEKIPFAILVEKIAAQMKEQTSNHYLKGMISTNVRVQNLLLFRMLPLPIKDTLLRIIFHFYGERNSCMSISNLGEITYPEELSQYIERVDFALTPRRDTACNCGIVSYKGMLFVNFTGKNRIMELEKLFFKRLNDMGCPVKIEAA